jgi:hypothetical protein
VIARLDHKQEASVAAAEAANDRARDHPRFSQAGLGGYQHPGHALQLKQYGIGHVDLNQEVRHEPNGRCLRAVPKSRGTPTRYVVPTNSPGV